MSKIACNVSNCAYYGSGNVCEADKISVSDTNFSANTNTKAGMEVGSFSEQVTSNTSGETQCVTFKPANK
ncbi:MULTISPECIES: DUF1540 domain-containing protein [unclassified Candidatus Frackibacter]|uniref:DUF1540 domain-containing protein n=1 Tax=unclassified Candidatus Frackibacter TaxID=2648818 RepID=UPI000793B38B|nr:MULTISPECIES: DUF1540 domain-containing protein [unclassified Candidatus Frackibacter]KXS40022.1 MAG: hypothetical protein AWU54_2131 [Candidatus Frackibacter sp. T328-2]SDC58162.1 protein of unknown function [Candidatus Frackibacter sp. WG11]SEM72201.1 protein of unknown function [Candidatus Frackibacter sp. WG12]SFL82018.1 protein of unknown function [Candidatus Frackibacter sp. WG13]